MVARLASLFASVLALVFAAGCPWTSNSNHCPGANPNDNCHEADAGPARCTSNAECSAPAAVCDVAGSMTCVQCTPEQASECSGATPACDQDRTCRACAAHAECASRACLPDGSCGDDAMVAYVDPAGTDNASCTNAMPCTLVSKALATNRPFVKLTGTTDEAVTVDNGRMVTFLADSGAVLTRTNNGSLLRVEDSAQLQVYDLEISGALGTNVGIAIPVGATATVSLTRAKVLNNAGGGISASGGALTVSQSTISGNTGGGISVMNGTFVIVGNVFFGNGTQAGTVGGIAISTTQNAANRLEFNSFNKNAATGGFGPAIQCMVGGPFVARNNIMSENGTLTNMDQVGGNCMHTYSIARPGTLPPGNGNSSMDPLFVNTTTGDLHVRAGSPVLGAADPSSNLTGVAERDLDGDVRTNPADIGADEVP